jgi:hypothetical protein
MIDKPTGLLASDNCPKEDQMAEWFVEGTEPVTECNRLSDDGSYLSEQKDEDSSLVDAPLPPAATENNSDGLFD